MLGKILVALSLLALVPSCRFAGICLNQEKCAKDDLTATNTSSSGGDCSSVTYLGSWKSNNTASGDTFTVASNCAVTSSKCGFKGTAVPATSTTFTVNVGTLTTTDTSGSTVCTNYSAYTCTYSYNSTTALLTLDCVSGTAYLTSGAYGRY